MVCEYMQAGEHDTCHGYALQSLPDIAVGNGDTEVDLEAGEHAELRSKVC